MSGALNHLSDAEMLDAVARGALHRFSLTVTHQALIGLVSLRGDTHGLRNHILQACAKRHLQGERFWCDFHPPDHTGIEITVIGLPLPPPCLTPADWSRVSYSTTNPEQNIKQHPE